MHVLQYVAFKLPDAVPTPKTPESIEEAKQEAVNALTSDLNDAAKHGVFWFDGCTVGGGRWNEDADEDEDGLTNLVVSHAEDSNAFQNKVYTGFISRQAEFEKLKSELLSLDLDNVLNLEDGLTVHSAHLYKLRRLTSLALHQWTFESVIYDWTNGTGNLEFLYKDVERNGNRWFIIPVDFHF
jgi:hypothetical protein